jgi:PD-(D/E)XK nuclease superfamily
MASNPKANVVTSWSFSRYSDYRACPAKFKYKHLEKLPEPPSPAMARGTAIHKLAEDFTNGKLRTLPQELALFKDGFKRLRGQKVKMVEEQWAFAPNWTLTKWNDWTGCWLRVKLDVAYINVEHNALVPIDHKTGKFREEKNEEYMLQLDLYGTAGFAQVPTVDVISPRLWYLDYGRIYPDPEQDEHEIEFFKKDATAMKKKWEARVAPMFRDRTFKPTPGDACRFCYYRKSNGGPCKF